MEDISLKYIEDLKAEIIRIRQELKQNGKDFRYHIGEMVLKNAHPRRRVFRIPFELWKLRKAHRAAEQYSIPEDVTGSREEYVKQLTGLRDELKFYQELRWSNLNYRIGHEVLSAFESPVRFLKLPFTLYSVRSGEKAVLHTGERKLAPIEGSQNGILFIATNGAGLGHLTRCLAVARNIRRLDSDVEIIFLTTSLALTTIHREGFTAYCIPSLMLIPNMEVSQWNALLKQTLCNLMDLYQFRTIVFDGATPYASISAAMKGNDVMKKIWIKRGSERSDVALQKRNDAESQFDYIVIPKEAGDDRKSEAGPEEKKHPVNPIVYLNKEELWSREDVRTYLKIPEGRKAVYVQLGAGNINDIDSDISIILRELRKHEELVMVLGESMIGNELKVIADDIIVIKDYPNSKYFNGFDFAVSACGYNSFHELLYFGVPAVFIPNMKTKTDDQYARAMIAQDAGAGIVVTDIRSEQTAEAISRLSDDSVNRKMRENAQQLIKENGALQAAGFILEVSDIKKPN